MKQIFMGLLLCIVSYNPAVSAVPKSDAHITGHIIDAQTREHIPYASIALKGRPVGVMSDHSGHFLLKNMPVGKQTLVVSFVGYKNVEQEVEVIPNKTIEVKFALETTATQMDEIVISGSRNETKKQESATIVNVIPSKLFARTASNNVAEVLNFQPGLRVEYNCSNCGVPQLRINGLEGRYSQILLDSRPIFSSLATVYGLEQLPAGMIERIEVVRGGGSALFGSNAIAGVVNIITKDPVRNSATLSNQTSFMRSNTVDVNTTLNASVVSDDYRTGAYIFGMVKDRDSYDRNGDGFSEVPQLKSETIGFRGFHKLSQNTRLTAEYHHMREFRRGGDMMEQPPHEANIAEQLQHGINGGGLQYEAWSSDYHNRLSIYSSAQSIQRQSYFGTSQNLNAYGRTKDVTAVLGAQFMHEFHELIFLPAQFTLGSEYTYNHLNDKMLGYNRIIDQKSITMGAFAQNEWKNERWGLLLGVRLDKHNKVNSAILSPRANIRYTPGKAVALRMSYSSGYRAPQAYEEDLHVAAVGGDVAIISVAPDLRPEYSKSYSGSIDIYQQWGQLETNLLIEGFYTRLDDVFTLVEKGHDTDGNLLLERQNASGANISGVNLDLKLGFTRKWILDAGFTFQSSRYHDVFQWSNQVIAHKKMLRSPDQYGFVSLTYAPNTALSLASNINYTGSMLVPHYAGVLPQDELVKTPAFTDIGLLCKYNFPISEAVDIELSGGVKNILDSFQKDIDTGVNRDAGFIYGPVFPRTIHCGIKFLL